MAGNRICPRCQGLFDVANWVCPHCGAEFAAPKPVRPGIVDRVLPSRGGATKALVGVIVVAFLVQIAIAKASIGQAYNGNVGLLGAVFGLIGGHGVGAGEYWRLISSGFLHGGLLHIGLNMFWFWQLGMLVEATFGRAKLIFIFFFCVMSGSLAVWWFAPNVPAIGASGGVVGLVGVMAVWGYRRGGTIGAMIKRQMIQSALFILLIGMLVSNVSNAGHIGGLVGGALIAWVVKPIGVGSAQSLSGRVWDSIALGTIAIVLVCLGFAGFRYFEVKAAEEQEVTERTALAERRSDAAPLARSIRLLMSSYRPEVLAKRDAWLAAAETLSEEATELEARTFARAELATDAGEIVALLRLRARAFETAASGEIDAPPAADDDVLKRAAAVLARLRSAGR